MAPVELFGSSFDAPGLDDSTPEPARRPLRWASPRWNDPQSAIAATGHAISLAAAGVLVVWFNRHQWFFGDEWEFFANRMHGGWRALFAPHNEHWSTGPVLIYRSLYASVGLRSYLPYVAVLVAFHLIATHLLWRLLRRAGVAPLFASALAAIFAVLGSGSENLLWAFQMGFVGSVALGLLHILLVDHVGPFGRRDRIAWVVAVVGLTFSGITVSMTAISGLVVLLRRNLKSALLTVAPPAAAYLVWLGFIGSEGLQHQERGVDTLLDAPTYVWTGLSSALERAAGLPGAGPTLAILLVVWLLRQGPVRAAPAAAPTAMAAGAACLFAVLSLGRSVQGIDQATSSRYVYIVVALLLPTVGRVLSHPGLRPLPRQGVVLVILGLFLLNNVAYLRRDSRAQGDREVQMRDRILAAARLVSSSAEIVSTIPEPKYSPDLTLAVLTRLNRAKALPAGGRIPESEVLAAAGDLQVALIATQPPAVTTGGPRPTVISGEGIAIDRDGCAVLTPVGGSPPHAEMRFAAPAVVPVRSVAGGELTVTLHSPVDPTVTGPPRVFVLVPGATSWLQVARAGPLAVVMPPGSAGQLCNVQVATAG